MKRAIFMACTAAMIQEQAEAVNLQRQMENGNVQSMAAQPLTLA